MYASDVSTREHRGSPTSIFELVQLHQLPFTCITAAREPIRVDAQSLHYNIAFASLDILIISRNCS